MKILVTGCAGFIGFHLSKALCENPKNTIIGLDNLNNYYSPKIKKDRLKILNKKSNFFFYKIDIIKFNKIKNIFNLHKFDAVFHLSAQAGVRYSITNPEKYMDSNIIGFFNILENCRLKKIKHVVSASSSSVYGDNKKFPLNENNNTDFPISFYAATKKSNEVMAHSYSYIYKMNITIVRFFTVYGPFGRPDMSLFKFVKNISNNKNIKVFNNGNHYRDFTYIDDVVKILKKLALRKINLKTPYECFNICSSKPISLKKFIEIIEKNLDKKAKITNLGMQKGDIVKTHGNNYKLEKRIGKIKFTKIETGIKNFVDWYRVYFNKQ